MNKINRIRKLVIAILGLLALIAARHGIEIPDGDMQIWIEGIISILTLLGIYKIPNEKETP